MVLSFLYSLYNLVSSCDLLKISLEFSCFNFDVGVSGLEENFEMFRTSGLISFL